MKERKHLERGKDRKRNIDLHKTRKKKESTGQKNKGIKQKKDRGMRKKKGRKATKIAG
jgi:hypothetical protein